jgi:LacI family transcriptional regulator
MTIKDVAKYSGVSITTISRVINNHPDVREEVRAKVWKAIDELHYVPNGSARDLGKTQTDTIGVVVRGVGNPFFNSVLHAIEKTAKQANYSLVMHQIGSSEDELSEGAMLVRSKRLKGIIFLGGHFDYTPEQIKTIGVPFVCCTYTNSFGSLSKNSYSSVYIDDYAEAFRAVKTLTDLGHKKIAVILGKTDDRSISELRFKGYCDALENLGIIIDKDLIIETESFNMGDAFKAFDEFLKKKKDFTAIFAIADVMGIAVMKALSNNGYKLPEDCSVIAIDGIEFSNYTIPTLSTLVQPSAKMGEQAVKTLIDVLNGKKGNCQLKVDTILRDGETLAKPKL